MQGVMVTTMGVGTVTALGPGTASVRTTLEMAGDTAPPTTMVAMGGKAAFDKGTSAEAFRRLGR